VRIKALLLSLLLALCVVWLPGSAHAQNSCSAGCVQWGGTGFQGSTSAPGTTVTGVTAGDTLHAYMCGTGPTAVTSATDNGTAMPISQTVVNGTSMVCAEATSVNTSAGSHVIVFNVTGTCTSCTTIVPEWAGAVPLASSNGALSAGGSSVAANGGNVTATGTALLETMYSALTNSGTPTTPSGLTIAVQVANINIAFENVSAGTFNPTWTTSSGGDSAPIVLDSVFQAGSPPPTGVTHSRLTKDVGQ
jgi:hypothetical protein